MPPAQQILGNFERLERTFAGGVFRGCPFVNAVAELKEPAHAANEIALPSRSSGGCGSATCWCALDVDDPEGAVAAALLLIDGAIAAALVRGDRSPRGRREARVLLKAAGVKLPKRGEMDWAGEGW